MNPIADLTPYPEYKESGDAWLGLLPAHWHYLRSKYLFREVDERSRTGREELLSVSHLTGVTPRSQKTVTMFLAESTIGYKICQPGDLVINTMWAWMGALGVARHSGIVSPAYGVYRPLAGCQIGSRYADLLLRSAAYAAEYQRRSTGVNSSRLRLYPESFLRIPVVVPPTEEQPAIVRFLDWANGRLEQVVRAKKRELALISEMLLVVTERALHLEGTRTLRLSTAAETVSRPVARTGAQSYTPIGLYNRGRGIFHKAIREGPELGDSNFFWVEEGDLVISGQFAWEGAVALARTKDSGCVASHRYPILRGRGAYAPSAVLLAVLRTPYGLMLLDHHSRGAAGRNRPLNVGMLLKEHVRVPPKSAHGRIAELLDQEYDVAESLAQTIRLINEFKARLVADLVTGRLDVREAAARLPSEAPGDVVEDDAGLSDETELEEDEASL